MYKNIEGEKMDWLLFFMFLILDWLRYPDAGKLSGERKDRTHMKVYQEWMNDEWIGGTERRGMQKSHDYVIEKIFEIKINLFFIDSMIIHTSILANQLCLHYKNHKTTMQGVVFVSKLAFNPCRSCYLLIHPFRKFLEYYFIDKMNKSKLLRPFHKFLKRQRRIKILTEHLNVS